MEWAVVGVVGVACRGVNFRVLGVCTGVNSGMQVCMYVDGLLCMYGGGLDKVGHGGVMEGGVRCGITCFM